MNQPMSKHIPKPLNDNCNYYTFQLNNKLNVFLVEDAETEEASGTMLVKIGHSHDTVIGIAHFLEHMLFNGTTKYPDENEYSKYITKNGGQNNAYTDHDHTCYFFTVQAECLEHSLDMFGNFFISPLLNPDSVDREKNAVDSEHIKNITNDSWRLQEIVRQAMDSTNPISNFGTGSAKTLAVPNIDKHVRHFFETHYSSHLMTLFVVAKNNIEIIKQKIIDTYSQIPFRITPENMRYFGNKIYNYPQTIKVVPLKQMEKLVISWDLPSYKHCPLRSPYHFLSHIIGHEGKNTIHYLLCQLGYISSLAAGTEIHCNDRCTFSISIMLTPIGSNHKEDILNTIFKYIELMKMKINLEHMEMLYNEQMTLDAFEFKYSIKNNPMEKAMEYAKLVNSYDFDLHDMLIIPYAKENFVPNVKANLSEVLNLMTIEKSIVIFVSNSYAGTTNLVDPDYGTEYSIENTYPDLSVATIDTTLLDLPNKNIFMSTGENMITLRPSEKTSPFKLNTECECVNLWVLPTNKFATPDVSVKVTINLPLSMESTELYIKSVLYFTSLLTEINYEKYMCTTANYDTDVVFDSGKLYINIFGNYDKILTVCEFIVNSLLNSKLITEKIFNTSVYSLTMSTTNSIMSPPYKRVGSLFSKKMCSKYYDNYDITPVLNSNLITLESVKNVITELLNLTSCTILVSGNCTTDVALGVGKIFENFVVKPTNSAIFESMYDTYICPTIELETVSKAVENSLEVNSAVLYNVFIGKLKYGHTENWKKQVCLLNILDAVMSNEYFDEIRTKESFGYIVGGAKKDHGDKINKHKYYSFIVQSPHKTPEEIINRTEKFIIDYKIKLQTLSDEDLGEVIDALVSGLEAPYNNLEDMASFVFGSEISAEFLTFDLKNQLVEEYSNIKANDLVEFYDDKFIKTKRAVVAGLHGSNNKTE